MHPVSVNGQGDVQVVVHDKKNPVFPAQLPEFPGDRYDFPLEPPFVPELDNFSPAPDGLEGRFGMTPSPQHGRIDDDIQTGEPRHPVLPEHPRQQRFFQRIESKARPTVSFGFQGRTGGPGQLLDDS